MTLGKKLSGYRTIRGLTQGQLGEKLNVSAQAVSKWENDLATPDIVTLKRLSELYHVTLDELVDLNKGFTLTEEPELEKKSPADDKAAIGFCIKCGVVISKENIGERSPRILCKDCVIAREKDAEYAAEEHRRAVQREIEERKAHAERIRRDKERKLNFDRDKIRKKRNTSFIVAGIIAAAILALLIAAIADDFSFGSLIVSLVLVYATFAFTSSMFFDGVVQNLVLDMMTTTINWPGLIFTFDLDGFLWLIGMKILFAVLGFIAGVLVALLGFILGFITSIFVYPFTLIKISQDIRLGNASNYI